VEEKIIEKLSEMLSQRSVVTLEELKVKAIRASLKALGLGVVNLEKEGLDEIACSFVDCPLSLKSMHFSEKVEFNGVEFYHLHTKVPSREEVAFAYEEYVRAKDFLGKLEKMFETMDKFFVDYSKQGQYLRVYSKRNRYAVFFTTIRDCYEDVEVHTEIAKSYEGEYVVVVKVEDKLDEFLKFFKAHSEKVKRANAKIWVVNPDKMSVDPFIGYPKDLSLISRFKNPRFATQINSLWRVKVDEID